MERGRKGGGRKEEREEGSIEHTTTSPHRDYLIRYHQFDVRLFLDADILDILEPH